MKHSGDSCGRCQTDNPGSRLTASQTSCVRGANKRGALARRVGGSPVKMPEGQAPPSNSAEVVSGLRLGIRPHLSGCRWPVVHPRTSEGNAPCFGKQA